jgi:transcriptional regulator with XRE-family HTH domain
LTPLEEVIRSLGARIIERRRQLDLSQGALAHRAGLRRDRLSRIENRHATPTLSEALALSRALALGLDELIAGIPPSAGLAGQTALFPQLSEILQLGSQEEVATLRRLLSVLALGYRVSQDAAGQKGSSPMSECSSTGQRP